MKKVIFVVIVIAVLLGIASVGGKKRVVAPDQPPKKQPLPVRVAQVARGDISSRVVSEGTARAVRREFLTFRKQGKVIFIGKDSSGNAIKEGSSIKGPGKDGAKGQLLAKIDIRDLEHSLKSELANVSQAEQTVAVKEASVKKAENDYNLAETELKRSKQLREKEVITQAKYEKDKNNLLNAQSSLTSAKADLQSSKAMLDAAKSKYEKAKLDLEGASIYAPFDGIITYLNISLGDYSGPESLNTSSEDKMLTTAPFVVIDPSEYEVSVELPSYMMNVIKEGQTAYITQSGLPFPNGSDNIPSTDKFPYAVAKVYSVSPAVNPGGRSVLVKVRTVDGAKNLRDGMFVTCRIVYAEKTNALIVPTSGIMYRLGKPYAFAVKKGGDKAERRDLITGIQSFDTIEIINGVSEGEMVVTDGKHMLVDGKEIEVLTDKNDKAAVAKGEDK